MIEGDQFDHGGMQLVFIPHGGCAALEVADVAIVFGDDEGSLELPGVGGIDSKVGG